MILLRRPSPRQPPGIANTSRVFAATDTNTFHSSRSSTCPALLANSPRLIFPPLVSSSPFFLFFFRSLPSRCLALRWPPRGFRGFRSPHHVSKPCWVRQALHRRQSSSSRRSHFSFARTCIFLHDLNLTPSVTRTPRLIADCYVSGNM